MIEITDANFEQETSTGNVLLDCFAPWCGPCKTLGTILESLEEKFPNVKFCKCNADESKAVAERFGVRNVPVVIFLKDGQKVESFTGIRPASYVETLLTKF